ncbi:hypothetical protein FB45DRAFT_78166 [Roridomyces roridus]|uniref:Uncharacterized protein n=1 Tax=Roridomyces roridus TaxID=1738132 RepID=A0AAD7F7Y4_9AGAR|nr:hypothetical protein FB45DRAFT_78166 [Roridomyces roridus]
MGSNASILSRLQQIRGRVPALQMFRFISEGDRDEPNFVGAQDMFLSAPALRDFTLTHFKSSTLPFMLSSQLTVYEGSAHPDVHLSVLSGAHNLLECRLGAGKMFENPPPTASNIVVTLPRLLVLRIVEPEMINHIIAPVLKYLRVEDDLPAVVSFVQRSACGASLKELILVRSEGCSSNTFKALLRALPALERLVYEPSRGDADRADLADALTLTGAEAHDLCRNLQTLAWSWMGFTAPAYRDSIRRMVQSRSDNDKFLFRVLSLLPVGYEGMGAHGRDMILEQLGLKGLDGNVEVVDWHETGMILATS